ncbi:endoplasmic reticulum metallopeptidase 1-like [Culicoides brevitarsis]|uniref:endoplasmic reticulum metallopeptidase 1-like n=1 Tax=Culicoides brevitarsis TaxID=469753 RepID=UPI00307C63EB
MSFVAIDMGGKRPHFIPIWVLVLIVATVIGLFFVGRSPLINMPSPLMKTDENSNSERFIAENAFDHIEHLSKNIGPRFTGTRNNEVLTVEYILKVVETIKASMDKSLDIETEVQIGDGEFYELWQQFTAINVYENLQNVIVKLIPKQNVTNDNWILMNSHFDSVPMSPGAGDDGTMVGIMLEMMRVLAKKPTMEHTLVFLFNGCEENSLQASHSFIKHYKYMDKIKLLINLDVAGPGGKELLFQTSPEHPWLMDAYFNAIKHPFATVIAEEIYQNGFIPSDTDFSNFREFVGPRLPAYDLAHIRNGFVYHTKHDGIENVDLGALQSTGDNLMGLLKELDSREELEREYSEDDVNKVEKYVFYDFFGTILIFYTTSVGMGINISVFCVLMILIAYSMYRMHFYEQISYLNVFLEYLIAVVLQVLGICLGLAITVFMAWFFNAVDYPMTWYSNFHLLFGIYFLQFFLINAMITSGYLKFRKNKHFNKFFVIQLQMHAYATILAILLLVTTVMKIRSAFILMPTLLFYLISTFFNVVAKLDTKNNKWIYSHLIGQIIPITFYFYLLDMFLNTIVPTLGRQYDGINSNPDLMFGLFFAIFAILTLQFFAPTLSLFKYGNYCIAALQLVFVTFVIILFTPLSFPYTEATAPQRFHVWHAQTFHYDYNQKLRKSDNGFYVFPHDRNGIKFIKDTVPLIKSTSPADYDMKEKCDTEILCGIPHYHVYYTAHAYHSIWLKANDTPTFSSVPEMTLESVEHLNLTRVKYRFQIASGTSHMSLHISPLPQAKIVKWSFTSEMKDNYSFKWNNRDVYFINYVRGLETANPYTFTIEVEKPLNWRFPYTFDIALASQFIHQPETHTKEFESFVESFPKWTTLQYFTSRYVGYQFQ